MAGFFLSLRSRLMLLTGLVFIPATGFIVYNSLKHRDVIALLVLATVAAASFVLACALGTLLIIEPVSVGGG